MEKQLKDASSIRIFRNWNFFFTIFGLSTIIFSKEDEKPVKISRFKFAYSVVTTGIIFVNFYVFHIMSHEKFERNNVANNLVLIYKIYLGNLTIPFLLLSNLVSSGMIATLLNDFIIFDKKNVTKNKSEKLIFFFVMFIVILASFTIELILRFPKMGLSAIADCIQNILFPLYCGLINQQFALCICWLEDKYLCLNGKLTTVLNVLSKQEGRKELLLSRRNKLFKMRESFFESAKRVRMIMQNNIVMYFQTF